MYYPEIESSDKKLSIIWSVNLRSQSLRANKKTPINIRSTTSIKLQLMIE